VHKSAFNIDFFKIVAKMAIMKRRVCVLTVLAAAFAMILPVSAQVPPAETPKYDFGDFKSSTLTEKAWGAFGKKDYAAAKAYAGKCREMYQEEALKQQGTLEAVAPKEKAFDYWALNDVGTCTLILGNSLEALGDKAAALEAFKFLSEKLTFAQCWDPKGWFWQPAAAAKQRVAALEFESM
jgi:hypothetical protein